MRNLWHYCAVPLFSAALFLSVSGCPPQEAATGTILVTLSPPEAAAGGAQWRTDTGEWMESGAALSDLAPGDYTITCSDITGWSAPAPKTITVTAGQETEMTAAYTKAKYTLTMAVEGNGTVSPPAGSHEYAPGVLVPVTATAAPFQAFEGWSGDLQGAESSTAVMMNGDMSITATFTHSTYPLSVSVNPTGGGTVNQNPSGTAIAVGATVTLQAAPALNYAFTGWSGDLQGTANPASVVMDGAKAITANFTYAPVYYTLTVSVAGGTEAEVGSVQLSPAGGTYLNGSQVRLTAATAPYGHFLRWTGAASGTANPLTITMDSNKTITAQFDYDPPEYTINTEAVPLEGGTIEKTPDLPRYAAGSTLELLATAAQGYAFYDWENGQAGLTNPFSTTVSKGLTIRARFDWTISFPDANLDAAVRDALGVDETATVRAVDLDAITGLQAANRGITNIEGLQHFRNLVVLDLTGNELSSLQPLLDNTFAGPGLTIYIDLAPDDEGLCNEAALLGQHGISVEGAQCTEDPITEYALRDYLPLDVDNFWDCPAGDALMAIFGTSPACQESPGCSPLTVTDHRIINGASVITVETGGTLFGQPCSSEARLTFTKGWFYLGVTDEELGLLPEVSSSAIWACPEMVPVGGAVYTDLGIHHVTLYCEQGALSDFVEANGDPIGFFQDVLSFDVYVNGVYGGNYIFARGIGPVHFNGFIHEIHTADFDMSK